MEAVSVSETKHLIAVLNKSVYFHENEYVSSHASASAQMLYFWMVTCTFVMAGYQREIAAYSPKEKTTLFMTSGSDSMGAKTNQPRLE